MGLIHASAESSPIQQAAGLVWWGVVIWGAAWCDFKLWRARRAETL